MLDITFCWRHLKNMTDQLDKMNKGQTRTKVLFLFLLFIGGAVLLPVVHRVHCAADHETHATTQCPICQFANTPVIATALHIAPIVEFIIVGDLSLTQVRILSSPLRGAAMARAPPAA